MDNQLQEHNSCGIVTLIFIILYSAYPTHDASAGSGSLWVSETKTWRWAEAQNALFGFSEGRVFGETRVVPLHEGLGCERPSASGSCCPSGKLPRRLLEPSGTRDINSICATNQAKDAQSPLQQLITIKTGKKMKKSVFIHPVYEMLRSCWCFAAQHSLSAPLFLLVFQRAQLFLGPIRPRGKLRRGVWVQLEQDQAPLLASILPLHLSSGVLGARGAGPRHPGGVSSSIVAEVWWKLLCGSRSCRGDAERGLI